MGEFWPSCPIFQFIFGLHCLTLIFLWFWTFIVQFITFSGLSLSIYVSGLLLDTICPVKLEFDRYLQYPVYDQ